MKFDPSKFIEKIMAVTVDILVLLLVAWGCLAVAHQIAVLL